MRPMIVLLLVGCTPHDAEVQGTYTVWLAGNSSATVEHDDVDLESATLVDCYHDEDDPQFIGNSGDAPDCESVESASWQTFMEDDGFYILRDDLEPWRTDAVLNGEGDLQLTVHHNLGNGEDFRFAFSIDPDFAPVVCTADEQGNAALEYVDGSSWLKEWSADEDGYTIHYLNAGAYQQNPGGFSDYWYFDSPKEAGVGYAKFGDDDFSSMPNMYTWDDPDYEVLYTNPDNSSDSRCVEWDDELEEALLSDRDRDNNDDKSGTNHTRLFYGATYYSTYCDDVPNLDSVDEYRAAIATELETVTAGWSQEMTEIYKADQIDFKIEDNAWRPVDDSSAGIDGWVEVAASWVRIKEGSTIEPGGSAEGDFQIFFEASQSSSHLLIHGTFKIDKIQEDKWAYEVLEEEKREESGVEYCGGAAMPD